MWLATASDQSGQDYISRFEAAYWTLNFPRPMMGAVITEGADHIRVPLIFYRKDDLAGLIWFSEDTIDHAQLSLFWVNWQDTTAGHIPLYQGSMGEIRLSGQVFEAELRSLSQTLQQTVGKICTPECRADLGDEDCQVTLRHYQTMGDVASVLAPDHFTDAQRTESDGWFDYGHLLWVSGANAGLRSVVKHAAGTELILQEAPPAAITMGDRYRLFAGCDRRALTCRDKFDNLINFQGEPQVPGLDAVLAYPGSV